MDMSSLGPAVRRALAPLLTQRLFYGAAISCAVGLALGAWLKPPHARTFSSGDEALYIQPLTTQTAEATDDQAPAPPEAASPDPAPTQVAALSPPAGDTEAQPRPAAQQADDADDGDDLDNTGEGPAPPPALRTPPAAWGDQPPRWTGERAPYPGAGYDQNGYARSDHAGDDYTRDDYDDGPAWDDPPPPRSYPRERWGGPPREPPPDWDGPSVQDDGG